VNRKKRKGRDYAKEVEGERGRERERIEKAKGRG